MGQKLKNVLKNILFGSNYIDRNRDDKTIFLSYNRRDKEIADRIDRHLSGVPGITVKRDVRDIGPWKSIREFMKGIRRQDYSILIVSDSYLKSANCMFEVAEVMKEEEFAGRIFPVVLEHRIFKPLKRVEYIEYWQQECDKLENAIKGLNSANAVELAENLRRYESIVLSIGEFLDLVSDMNNPDIKDIELQIEEVIKSVLESGMSGIGRKRLLGFVVAVVVLVLVSVVVFGTSIIKDNSSGSVQEDASDISDSGSIVREREVMSDWLDSDGGRPTYTDSEIKRNILGNQIVFNSLGTEYSDGDCKALYPGDEKDFVKVWWSNAGADDDGSWESENVILGEARPYMIHLDINNNNPKGYDAVAKDTKVALNIPTYSDTQIPIYGYIESSNAEPSKIWDGVVFSSDENKPFHLKFRPNTATLHNMTIGADNGLQLSDDIVSNATEGGTLIGYDDLNGEIPGGSHSEVTAWIDVIYDQYGVKQKVRKLGNETWEEFIEAEIGDQVEFQIEYSNASVETQNDVMIRDILPGNLKYVPGTTKLYNSNCPNWAAVTPDGDIVTRGINIGSYVGSPDGQNGGNAFVRFTAEVVDTDLACGENFIYNWGRATVGDSLVENYSVVIVQKPE